ncbi:MAG: hypothetical protein A2070_06945 [Bdellovibrionales bacterium GWC1_52_8]|nr:MAG: hypothetical protein A2Z97_08975 [Bdellovibrionales bacterium GWB1_52_6]OFZ03393.1 MAG: hypothetical protein A2X97_05460 [Bdellovibrionales bacterium GWA1_52_35]OFZ40269.1 MAG: hypothetical protein A2070_06945 [Bdellovibrionales bacterium GWC1_52_8]
MDGKTMEEVRTRLMSRWKQLSKDPVKHSQQISPLEVNPPQAEVIDIAQALEEADREMSLAEQERRELIAIERALSKMATANFGICEDCGEDIPAKRLFVLPEARLCASCQAFYERQTSRTRVASGGR